MPEHEPQHHTKNPDRLIPKDERGAVAVGYIEKTISLLNELPQFQRACARAFWNRNDDPPGTLEFSVDKDNFVIEISRPDPATQLPSMVWLSRTRVDNPKDEEITFATSPPSAAGIEYHVSENSGTDWDDKSNRYSSLPEINRLLERFTPPPPSELHVIQTAEPTLRQTLRRSLGRIRSRRS